MLRHLLLICTLVLSWQQETLSSAINLMSPSNIHSDFYMSTNDTVNAIQLDSDEDDELTEDLRPSAFPQRKPYDECGVHSQSVPLITSGRSVMYGEWPWYVSTNYFVGEDLYNNCGGTLVSLNKVITAGHCVINSDTNERILAENYLIIAGFLHTNWTEFQDEGIQIMNVSEIALHPHYGGSYYTNDIAVVTLKRNVEITRFVRPACLWDDSDNLNDIMNIQGTIVGEGVNEKDQLPEILKMGHVQSEPRFHCFVSNPVLLWRLFNSKTICTRPIQGTNICKGDSGSGLFYRRDNKWVLRGIASGGPVSIFTGLCQPQSYGVFTDVARHRDFVDENLK